MSDWNPDQYRRFAAERAQPFHDLLALIEPGSIKRAVDLGCGPGQLTVTAEEGGLKGSEYYGTHPLVPAAKTAIALNYDALYPWGRAANVVITGDEVEDRERLARDFGTNAVTGHQGKGERTTHAHHPRRVNLRI